jgi:hypothetical protein
VERIAAKGRRKSVTNGLVNGGRWLVASVFAIEGVTWVWSSVVTRLIDSLTGFARSEPVSFFLEYEGIMSSGTLLLCAWGIFNWRVWGRYLAVFLATFGVIVAIAAVRFGGGSRSYVALTFAIVLNSLVLIWLLLPSVRAEYARKALTA